MNKDILLKLLGLTEEEIIEEVSKYNLSIKEIDAFNKGKDFGEKIAELDDLSKRRVILSLIYYGLANKNGDK